MPNKTEEELIEDFFLTPRGFVSEPAPGTQFVDVPHDVSPEKFFMIETEDKEKPIIEYKRGELGDELTTTGGKVLQTMGKGTLSAAETLIEVPSVVATGVGTQLLKGYEGITSLFTGSSLNDSIDRMMGYDKYPDNLKSFVRSQATKYMPEWADSQFDLSDDIYKGVGWIGEKHEKATDYAGESAFNYSAGLGVSPEIQALYATANKMSADMLLSGLEAITGKGVIKTGKVATKTGKSVLDIATGKYNIEKLRKRAIENAVKTAEENWIKQISDNQQVINHLKDSVELENTIPGFKLDIADAAKSEMLLMEKRSLLKTEQGAKLVAKMRDSNKQALAKYADEMFGIDSDVTFRNLVEQSDGTYKGIIGNLDNEIMNTQKRLSRFQIDYERQGRLAYKDGTAMQRELFKMYKLKKAKGETLWKGIEDVDIDVSQAITKANEILQTKNLWNADEFPLVVRNLSEVGGAQSAAIKARTAQLDMAEKDAMSATARIVDPEGAKRTLSEIQRERAALANQPIGGEMSIREIKDLYSDVNSTYTMEKHRLKSDIDPTRHKQRMRYLAQMKESLEGVLDAAETNPTLSNSVNQYRAAKEFWKNEVAIPFQNGIAGDILIPGAKKDFIMAGEKVVENAFKKAEVNEFRDFVSLAKQSEPLYTRLRDSIVREYENTVTKRVKLKDGNIISVIDDTAHNNFFMKHGAVLDEVPEIKTQLKNINHSFNNIQQTHLALAEKKARVQDSQLYKLIDAGDPQVFFNKIKTTTGAKEIMDSARATGVPKEAVQRAAASLVYKNSLDYSDVGYPVINPKKMIEYLNKNDGLKKVLSKPHIDNMVRLSRGYDKIGYKLNFDIRPEAVSPVDRALRFTGRTASQIVTNIRHMKQRIVSPTFVAQDLIMSTLATMNKSKINEILTESMFKPDLANLMDKVMKEQVTKGKVSFNSGVKLYNKLYDLGLITSITGVHGSEVGADVQTGVDLDKEVQKRNLEAQKELQQLFREGR